MNNLKQKIKKELDNLCRIFANESISKDYNFHNFDKSKENLRWDGFKNIAFTLSKSDYGTLYTQLLLNKDYSFLLMDGGILQLMYQFHRNELKKHTLSFYPNPFVLQYFKVPDEFYELYYSDEIFGDQSTPSNGIVPFRFDFSGVHIDIVHPITHQTYFGIDECRIPINGPVTPNTFIDYVLRNFYTKQYLNCFGTCGINRRLKLHDSITANERNIFHLSIE